VGSGVGSGSGTIGDSLAAGDAEALGAVVGALVAEDATADAVAAGAADALAVGAAEAVALAAGAALADGAAVTTAAALGVSAADESVSTRVHQIVTKIPSARNEVAVSTAATVRSPRLRSSSSCVDDVDAGITSCVLGSRSDSATSERRAVLDSDESGAEGGASSFG